MQEKNLYEYAVIRLVPKIEREEFINIGVLLFCKSKKFLQTKWFLDISRVHCLASLLDIDLVKRQLESFEQITKGDVNAGTIAQLDIPSRFRWLTASRSSIVQTSRIHPGYTDNLEDKLEKLFQELVAVPAEQ
ncbi:MULTISPECIES: DUF3037 domain-containing protein [Chitinophagaceae]